MAAPLDSRQIADLVAIANQIGNRGYLTCRYTMDRKKGQFAFCFYRRGAFLGSTMNPKKVLERMKKYATAN